MNKRDEIVYSQLKQFSNVIDDVFIILTEGYKGKIVANKKTNSSYIIESFNIKDRVMLVYLKSINTNAIISVNAVDFFDSIRRCDGSYEIVCDDLFSYKYDIDIRDFVPCNDMIPDNSDTRMVVEVYSVYDSKEGLIVELKEDSKGVTVAFSLRAFVRLIKHGEVIRYRKEYEKEKKIV